MSRAEKERIATKIKAYMRRDRRAEAEAQVSDVREATAGSSHPDALRARGMLELADEAGTPAKRERFLQRAWDYTKDYVNNRGSSKGGTAAKATKKKRAAEWQIQILPRVKQMVRGPGRKHSDMSIAARLASNTRTEKEDARSVETVRRFVAEVRKAERKK